MYHKEIEKNEQRKLGIIRVLCRHACEYKGHVAIIGGWAEDSQNLK